MPPSAPVHVLEPFSKPDWPYVRELHSAWPQAQVHAGGFASLRYRTKLGFLMQLPKLFFFGLRVGLAALAGGQRPAAFVTHTDFEVLGLVLAQLIRGRSVPIYLVGFIYTVRRARWLTWLRQQYFRFVLGLTRGVVCHSTLETSRYVALFRLPQTPFVFLPLSFHIEHPADLRIAEGGYAVTAGRAERDYGLLGRAWRDVDLDLRIICDTEAPVRDVPQHERIHILRQCFDADFLRELAEAGFVVVPLKDAGLSAGQMVLLQSMSLGKPVIISRTPTTEEYGEHLETLYFVEFGSEAAMREAVRRVTADPALRARIGAAARRRFEQRHALPAYCAGMRRAIEDMLAKPRR